MTRATEADGELYWAATVVQSRVFRPPPSFCFMPVADMMNASLTPNMEARSRIFLTSAME